MRDAGPDRSVVITDIHMPFWSMVVLMVKWAIAAIPAVVILGLIGYGLSALLAAVWPGLSRAMSTVAAPETSYRASVPARPVEPETKKPAIN